MGKEIKGTSPILHGKTNVNGKQTLTENKIESKKYTELPGDKLKQNRTVKLSKGGKV